MIWRQSCSQICKPSAVYSRFLKQLFKKKKQKQEKDISTFEVRGSWQRSYFSEYSRLALQIHKQAVS